VVSLLSQKKSNRLIIEKIDKEMQMGLIQLDISEDSEVITKD